MTTSRSLLIIPAKLNSSRVSLKNFRPFYNSQSLVDLAIQSALNANLNIPIIVSTNNLQYDYQSPSVTVMHRDDNLSLFETPIVDVLKHILLSDDQYTHFDNIILMQPTSPFRSVEDIQHFVSFSQKCHSRHTASFDESCSVFSSYRVEDAHPARMYFINDQTIEPVLGAESEYQCQDLSDCFHRNGCFYSFSTSAILNNTLYSPNLYHFPMSYSSSINIDTIVDFNIAKLAYPSFLDGLLSVLPE